MGSHDHLDLPAWTSGGPPPRLIVRAEKHDVEYLPTWDPGDGGEPRGLEEALDALEGVEGLMYPQDARKLYELAWFSPGDVLEVGTYKGRSAGLMGLALRAAGNPARIVSLDVDPAALAEAGANLNRLGLGDRTLLVEGSAGALLRRLPGVRPGLVYVDGDHTFRGVRADLQALEPIVPRGSVVVLHDYEGYEADEPYWVQVAEASAASWLARDCIFIGRFGLCGAFARRSGGPPPCDPTQADPLLLHLRPPEVSLARSASTFSSRLVRAIDYRIDRVRRSR